MRHARHLFRKGYAFYSADLPKLVCGAAQIAHAKADESVFLTLSAFKFTLIYLTVDGVLSDVALSPA
jgi:hypothetical protein